MPDNVGRTLWSSSQAYSAAILCLLLGVCAGYVARARSSPAVLASSATVPGARAVKRTTPERLKSRADKQAEPLLARLEHNPTDAALLAEVGKTYLYGRQLEQATEYYEKSAAIRPDPQVLTTLGGIYHFTGADNNAIEAWNRALSIDPNYADALFNLGLVQWQSKSDARAAIAAWEKLLRTNPNHPRRAYVEALIVKAKQHN